MSMKPSTVLTRLSAVLCASALLVCGCAKEAPQVPPASLAEIADATFTINGGIGQGVFVGFNDHDCERIFFLTARHVATYARISESTLNLTLGGKNPMKIKTAKDRWFITNPKYDTTWFELSPEETNALAQANGLRYITLNTPTNAIAGKGIVGTGLWEYERHPSTESSATDDIRLTFGSQLVQATNSYPSVAIQNLSAEHNRKFRECPTSCFVATAKRTANHGESGGAAFIRQTLGNQTYWLLVGLIAGGNEKNPIVTAVVPLDVPADVMRYGSTRLIDHPELW